ncbi:unnamed protein product [Absidia cylindrospora]
MKFLTVFVAMPMLMAMANQVIKKTAALHVTEPHEAAILYKNETVNVAWMGVTPTMEFLQIKLMRGSPKSMTPIKLLATDVLANKTHVAVVVPENVPTGNDYALLIGPDSQSMVYVSNLTIADSHPQQNKSMDTPLTNNTSGNTNPMRLPNGRKVQSSTRPVSSSPDALLKFFVAVAFVSVIIP